MCLGCVFFEKRGRYFFVVVGIFVFSFLRGQSVGSVFLEQQFREDIGRIQKRILRSNYELGHSVSVLLNGQVVSELDSFVRVYVVKLGRSNYRNDVYGDVHVFLKRFYVDLIDKHLKVYLVREMFEVLNLLLLRGGLSYEKLRGFDVGIQKICVDVFFKNDGLAKYKDSVIYFYAKQNGYKMMNLLFEYKKNKLLYGLIDETLKNFWDDVVICLHRRKKAFGVLAEETQNKYLKTLYSLSLLKKGYLYYPFFEEIANEGIGILEVEKKMEREAIFFDYLIDLRQKHVGRMVNKDTPLSVGAVLGALVKFGDEHFVTRINQGHYLSEERRFLSIKDFNVRSLYYLIVCGDEHLYTSSFIYIYKQMLKKMGKGRNGLEVLELVGYDKFRKFIRVVARYNFLNNGEYGFLKNVDFVVQKRLMERFVKGIVIDDKDYIEEASSVVNAFVGFSKNSEVLLEVYKSINEKIGEYEREGNKRGKVVYDIFKYLIDYYYFDKRGVGDVMAENFKVLKAEGLKRGLGVIFEEVLFYADDDAVNSFNYLLYVFGRNKKWRVRYFRDWVCVESLKGTGIKIYVNKPYGLDSNEYPINHYLLNHYLFKAHIQPTIFAHRGHSYFLTNTLNQINPYVGLVFLGACGSNGVVEQALRIAPFAQVVATRQVATSVVNSLIFYEINEVLRMGKDIEWKVFWRRLDALFKKTKYYDVFLEYIAPHQNLSMLFMKMLYLKLSEMR